MSGDAPGQPREVDLDLGDVTLPGDLTVPDDAVGLVVFAHGSGSSRKSPRNRQVAAALNERGLATLLFDLLTEAEAGDRSNVFDIDLLASRLHEAIGWSRHRDDLAGLPVGLFGSSTGAAAALTAAARGAHDVAVVVSRGGRPDLAAEALGDVQSPVQLIVGGDDTDVLKLNREAADMLTAECDIAVVPGAGHLFEGPGELEQVAEHAADWFTSHLSRDRRM